MKKFYKLLMMLLVLIVMVVPPTIQANTTAIKLSIDPSDVQTDGTFKTTYLTGSDILSTAKFSLSGNATSIPDAKLVITIPKANVTSTDQVNRDRPIFSRPLGARDLEITSDANNWYAKFSYDALNGGTTIDIPFIFSFKNLTTPGGFNTTVKFDLLDATNQILQTATRTYTSQIREKTSYKIVRTQYDSIQMTGDSITATKIGNDNFLFTSDISTNQPEILTASGSNAPYVQYEIGLRHIDNTSISSETEGSYATDIVRIVDKLPSGAKMAGTPNAQGQYVYTAYATNRQSVWTYDASTHSAIFVGQLIPAIGNFHKTLGYADTARSTYGAVLNVEFPSQNYATTHVNKATLTEGFGSSNPTVYPERQTSVKFNNVSNNNLPYNMENRIEKSFWTTSQSPTNIFSETVDRKTQYAKFYLDFVAIAYSTAGVTQPDTVYVTEISDHSLDSRLYYERIRLPSFYGRSDGNSMVNPQIVRNTGFWIIGVDGQNRETILGDTPAVDEWINIGDSAQKYKKIVIRFKSPLAIEPENGSIRKRLTFEIDTLVTSAEWSTWRNDSLGNGTRRSDNLPNSFTIKYYKKSAAFVTETTRSANAYYNASSANITAHEGKQTTINKIYDGLPVELRIGYAKYNNSLNDVQIDNVKHITLIPDDLEFDLEKSSLYNREYTVIPNYKGTGKKALIIYVGKLTENINGYSALFPFPDGRNSFYIAVNGKPSIAEGDYKVEHYMVWDENKQVIPQAYYANSYAVRADTLDMNENGKNNDQLLSHTNTIHFVPPREVILTKEVSLDKASWTTNVQNFDLGTDFYYKVNIINKTDIARSGLSIIDVLPYPGDKSIVPNSQGQYTNRESVYQINLTEFIEKIPDNAAFLQKWNVLYSTSSQGNTTAQTNAVAWVPRSSITNIATVKMVKFVLKTGQTVAKDEINSVILKSRIPYDTTLSYFAKANNSAAYSLNNVNFVEGNKVSSNIIKYKVNGYAFKDQNVDSLMQTGEAMPNRRVRLMNANGTPYVDKNGRQVTALTNSDGYYEMDVYERGTYYVEIVKLANEDVTIKHALEGSRNEKDSFIGSDSLTGSTATLITNVFTLGENQIIAKPAGMSDADYVALMKTLNNSLMMTRNFGFTDKLVISGTKTWDDLENRANSRPNSIYVQLYADGVLKETKLVYSPWTYRFINLPQVINNVKVEYRVDEVPIANYTKSIEGYNITNKYTPTNVFGTIKVIKVDEANPATKLQGVTFQLKQGDKVIQTQKTNNLGEAVFNRVPFGEYSIVETATIAGYVLDSTPQTVYILRNNDVVKKQITNKKNTVDVCIIKVDYEDRSVKLEGVEFKLLSTNNLNTPAIQTKVSNVNGCLTFTGLSAGTYYIKETKTKPGYILLDTFYRLVINPDMTIQLFDGTTNINQTNHTLIKVNGNTIEIANTKKRAFPRTGGIGTLPFIGAGVVLLVFGMYTKKKEEKNEN